MGESPVTQPGAFCLLCTVLFSFFPLFIFFLSSHREEDPSLEKEGRLQCLFFMGNSVTLQKNVSKQPFFG